MFIKKMVLKGKNETCAATLRAGETALVYLPAGAVLKAAEINGKSLAFSEENEAFLLPIRLEKDASVALLAKRNGAPLFGSFGVRDEESAKRRLSLVFEESQAKRDSLIEKSPDDEAKQEIGEIAEETPQLDVSRDEAAPIDSAEPSEFEPQNKVETPARAYTKEEIARERIEKGTPFPFLEEAIPGSRWAMLEEDGERFYLGLTKSEDGEKVLYATDGLRDAPSLENAAFFPSPEDEEIGFFIKEI